MIITRIGTVWGGYLIKKNSAKYKKWLDHRNKKNLKRRTKRNLSTKHKLQHTEQYYNNYSQKKKRRVSDKVFKAPMNLSLVKNETETIKYYNDIIEYIKRNKTKEIYIDIADCKVITIDAIMYLIAVMKEIRIKNGCRNLFKGNMPKDKEVSDLVHKSGFFKYVNAMGKNEISRETDTVQIECGDSAQGALAKKVSDFHKKRCKSPQIGEKYLYRILMELMTNTKNHAYTDKKAKYNKWYIFVEHVPGRLRFCFIDTGEGIARTVAKKLTDIIANDSDYIISAFNGDRRTQTKKENRGHGLPSILYLFKKSKITNLKVIANKGNVSFRKGVEPNKQYMEKGFQGTLIYWEIKRSIK